MKNIQHSIIWIIVFGLLVAFGYWGLMGIKKKNLSYAPSRESAFIDDEVLLDIVIEETEVLEEDTIEEVAEEEVVSAEHEELIAKLQKLIDDGIYMKKGSQGTRVGTVQEFLNIFQDKNARIDNDFGAGTVSAVKAFQTEAGIIADGETGPQTYGAMIDWLKK